MINFANDKNFGLIDERFEGTGEKYLIKWQGGKHLALSSPPSVGLPSVASVYTLTSRCREVLADYMRAGSELYELALRVF